MGSVNRRLILQALPFIGASAALPAMASPIESADFVAIPREAYDAIVTWTTAQRRAVSATNAWCDATRTIDLRKRAGGPGYSPAESAVCDALWRAHIDTAEAVGPAREKMLFALLKATRGGAHV
jgi:hypothetical protein